mmetsp:Transcript_5100/g.15072  ORF Transcript_5100/g.15072 Transcript_5100/m.15072 type:complete len:513 (-) Transcript_5100:1415-2953(-)
MERYAAGSIRSPTRSWAARNSRGCFRVIKKRLDLLAHDLKERAELADLLVSSGGGKGDESSIFVLSSDAGKMAGTSQTPNWTSGVVRLAKRMHNCALDAVRPVFLLAGGDNRENLAQGLSPNMDALDMMCMHNVLFCCKARLTVARAECVCLSVGNYEVLPECRAIDIATACQDCCTCSRRPCTLAELLVTGDLHNLMDMEGLGSVRTDVDHESLHVINVGGKWLQRGTRAHDLACHAIPGERCPHCLYMPKDAEDVEKELAKRAALVPGSDERSRVLRAHFNVIAPRVLRWLPKHNVLFGIMHMLHNLHEQFMTAVWHDAKILFTKQRLWELQWDYIDILRKMGCGIPAPDGKRGVKEQNMPKLKGPDLAILRTTLGMLAFLQLVYSLLDEVGGKPKPKRPATANNKSATNKAVKRVAAAKARTPSGKSAAEEAAAKIRTSKLRLACTVLAAFYRLTELVKDTQWDDSTPELRADRAKEYSAAFEDIVTDVAWDRRRPPHPRRSSRAPSGR